MENLNAENIKRALEEMNMIGVNPTAIRKALALITSQEQRIEAYRQELGELRVALAEANKERQELNELREHADLLKQIRKGGAEKCVSCGETIPEGRQVCPGCEGGGRDGKNKP